MKEVAISSNVCRDDDLYKKAKEIHNKLRRKAAEHNLHFVDTINLNKTDLNGSGLHLNPEGPNKLGKKFLRFIDRD